MLDDVEIEIDRLSRADELGKKAVTVLITLHGGACLAVLSFLANMSPDSAVTIDVAGIKTALTAFLTGVSSVFLALLVSYSFYAMPPHSGWYWFWNKYIVLTNTLLGIASIVAFVFGVGSLIVGATAQP